MAEEVKEEVIEFKNWPACGSAGPTFVESLANEVKARGMMRPEYNFYAQIFPVGVKYGVVRDAHPAQEAKVMIGSTFPVYRILTDVCLGTPEKPCGCIFARKVIRTDAKKTLNMETGAGYPGTPNRADRRHPPDELTLN